jgi:beta-lactamase class A
MWPAPAADLMAQLAPLLASAPGKVSLAYWHLETGERFSIGGDSVWPAASLIKVPLAIAAYQAVEKGELALEERVLVPALLGDTEAEFDNLGLAPQETRFDWRKIIDRMLTESDNSATNALVDRLGLGALQGLKLNGTALNRRMLDTSASARGLDNFTTAEDTVTLLVSLQRGELLNPSHTSELLGLMRQQRDNEKFAKGLSAEANFAHKTGELPGYRHDAGLVLAPSPWAVAMLTQGAAEADALQARVATLLSFYTQSRRQAFQDARNDLATERTRLIPDPRLEWDTLNLTWRDGEWNLTGVTTLAERLKAPLVGRATGETRLLLGQPGVVTTPCLQLRGQPGHAQELTSQLRLGDDIQILEAGSDWTLLRGPDGYIAYGKSTNLEALSGWLPTHMVAQPLISVKSESGKVYQLSGGSSLRKEGSGYRLPDGELVRVSPADVVALGHRKSPADALAFAEKCLGLPYLWGGTTGWGIDCSGLTQLAYAVCGAALPRDADQQQLGTQPVLSKAGLLIGDLVFFPGHVGLYRGGDEFVHASAKAGRVTINSFEPTSLLYDAWLDENFVQGGRSPLSTQQTALGLN